MSSMYGSRGPTGNSMGRPTGKSGGYNVEQLQQFTPEQMQLFSQMFGHVGPESYLSKLAGGDQSAFEQSEAPAMRQFSGLQGQLASRFSGMGMGARRSSGFQNTSNQATSDFAQGLQSRRMDLRNQAIRDLMGLSNQLLGQRPQEQFLQEPEKPFWQKLLGGALPIAGAVGGGALGSLVPGVGTLAGASLGGKLGGMAGQSFY